ncbi:MAG: hypothetical protein P8Y34_04740 [Anaerolineales bacterium]
MNDQPYIYGNSSTRDYPLQDHLPEYRPGIAENWLKETIPTGSWILSPFGSSPQTSLEAARAGYRVLLPVHNPVLRFVIENLANPPTRDELNSALASLASSYKGTERLKPFILSLYETDCPQCGAKTSALSFSWAKNTRELLTKTCRCQTCGEETQTMATPEDTAKAREFSDRSLIHARALTRVSSPTDPIRVHVENALGSYPPRSVYALFSVLNKLTGSELPAVDLIHLEILLLHAFQRCSHPLAGTNVQSSSSEEKTDEPLQELNVWYALEDALDVWTLQTEPIPTTLWPAAPPEKGGICIFPGRVKDLITQLDSIPVQAILTVFPRPTPSFWGLSALWTGWLWGQEAAAPLRGVLSVGNYDWNWITKAVENTLAELGKVIPGGVPVLGLVPEADTSSLISASSASLTAGLKLNNIALDPDQRLVQTQWVFPSERLSAAKPESSRELIRKAGFDLLKKAGEPLHNLLIHAAGICSLAQAGYPDKAEIAAAEDYFPQLLRDFEENIAYRQGFLHYPEAESWWHLELELDPLPLSDRVEISLVRLLIKGGDSLSEKQLLKTLAGEYPALSTPRSRLIQACLDSYAEHSSGEEITWALKPNDQPASRIQDLEEMGTILREIGTKLGYATREAPGPENTLHLIWQEGNAVRETFFVSVSGLLNKIVTTKDGSQGKQWMILPGSRAPLVDYKMNQNPLLAEMIRANWQLVKFRHLRRLSEQGD